MYAAWKGQLKKSCVKNKIFSYIFFLNLRFKNQEAHNLRKILIVFFFLSTVSICTVDIFYVKQQDFNASKWFLQRLYYNVLILNLSLQRKITL